MLESGSHGTLCASAISAQGVVDDGRVLGMAPNATISSIGNHYSGGHSLDAWRFIAEGYDGDPSTQINPHRVFLFRVLFCRRLWGRWIFPVPRLDNQSLQLKCIYAVAIGNGGHGFEPQRCQGLLMGYSQWALQQPLLRLWGQSAPWSNRGPERRWKDGSRYRSSRLVGNWRYALNNYDNANQAWTTWGGTSLATPVVAGLLALVEEAWLQNRGYHPKSQELRDFVLSTSDDRGYESFVQGGGWMNASRAVKTLAGENGTWSASPAQWNTGFFHGTHRDANLNYIAPGESQTFDVKFENSGSSELNST